MTGPIAASAEASALLAETAALPMQNLPRISPPSAWRSSMLPPGGRVYGAEFYAVVPMITSSTVQTAGPSAMQSAVPPMTNAVIAIAPHSCGFASHHSFAAVAPAAIAVPISTKKFPIASPTAAIPSG
jgi:hypothetical protein